MGAPKPWPTRWPEPTMPPRRPDIFTPPLDDPDYDIEEFPAENPFDLPEEYAVPAAVTWAVTHPCNLRCDHCYDVVPNRRHDLTTDQALLVIDKLAKMGIQLVVFSGGEPLLRRDLFVLMMACTLRGMAIGMRSNGTLIDARIAARLAARDLAVAGISLDGADASMHDAIRGKGAFARTMRGIRHLIEAGIRVNVEVVLSKRNMHQALDVVYLAEHLGVAEVSFSAMTSTGRARHLGHEWLLDFPSWQQLNAQLYAASQCARVNVSPACVLAGACPACIEANITCDGNMTACYLSQKPLFNLLEVTPVQATERLAASRTAMQNNCGRLRWLLPHALPIAR